MLNADIGIKSRVMHTLPSTTGVSLHIYRCLEGGTRTRLARKYLRYPPLIQGWQRLEIAPGNRQYGGGGRRTKCRVLEVDTICGAAVMHDAE